MQSGHVDHAIDSRPTRPIMLVGKEHHVDVAAEHESLHQPYGGQGINVWPPVRGHSFSISSLAPTRIFARIFGVRDDLEDLAKIADNLEEPDQATVGLFA